MARLFPKINPADIENPGEQLVARALVEQLPSRVEVFHSFNWLVEGHRGVLQEGECDFVLLDPEQGVLFVEVKGGSLSFDPAAMVWRRALPNGGTCDVPKDPFAQVQRSMHEIVKRISETGFRGSPPPITFGFAVAFPDCNYKGSLPMGIHPDLILDASRCGEMAPRISRIFERFARSGRGPLTPQEVDSVREALYPRFNIMPVIWRKVEDQEARLQRLTKEQEQLLKFMSGQTKAAIRGVAGSGKTILALAKAQETARRGLRTLFLCYNRPLKEWLEQASPESLAEHLVIDTFHGLAADWCKKASVRWPGGGDDVFWSDGAPDLLMQACDLIDSAHKFDVVIVDEGQDFHELWWTAIDGVFRDPADKACYYVFCDPKQNIYVDNPGLPAELGEPFNLPRNCRNTLRIAEHCAKLVDVHNEVRDGAPMGDEPEFLKARTTAEAFEIAGKKVREWCMPNAGGLKPSQVAVLAPSGTDKYWPESFKTVHRTKDFDGWRADKGVLIASWARFKGLEADAIVIIEASADESPRESANRYVARSRAKHILVVVTVHEAHS